VYDRVAKNRAAISVWLGYEACGIPRVRRPAPAATSTSELGWVAAVIRECAAGAFVVVCAIALARGSEDEPRGTAMAALLGYPRIFQKHDHLAPEPSTRTGTLVVEGKTSLGATIDPLTGSPPLMDLTPGARPRVDPLMRAFYASLSRPNRSIYLAGFRDYVAKFADKRPAEDKMLTFTVEWIEADIPAPPGSPAATALESLVPRRKLVSRP
jgi:hypothetical protein